jgi:hypothetical protein
VIQVRYDPVRGGFDLFIGIPHGYGKTGNPEHGNIVFCITYGNALFR